MTDDTLRQAQGPVFPETDVTTARPRTAIVLAWLVVGALVATLVVVFAVGTLTHVLRVGSEGAAVPGLSEVEQNTGIDLPDGTEVIAAERSDGVFSAELLLPSDALPDFPLAGYATVESASDELTPALAGESVVEYLAAASSTLEASAAIVERDGRAVLFVDVRAVG
jgi:hypothetical protein